MELRRQNDGSFRGRCPVHEGQSADSLALRHIEPKSGDRCGRAQLRCFGGCDERAVLDLAGMGLGDLYDEAPPKTSGTVLRDYAYTDANDWLLGVVRRTEPKSFRQATPTDSGWAAKSSDALKQTPYRLGDLVKAVENGEMVYVVEGEKDADALARAGVTATCNAGGAGKWGANHAHWLRGADVVVVRDRDDAGHRHADQVIATLRGVAKSVRLVETADGKDASDHLDAGLGVADLVAVEVAPDAGPGVLVRLADVQAETLHWLWSGRLPAGKLVTLDGDPSLGKSTLALTLAAHISTGKPWPDGEPCETGDVIVLSAEDGLADTIRPRLDAAGGDPARVHALTAVRAIGEDGTATQRPPTLADVAAIRSTIEQTGARLLVVDVLMAYMPGKTDSHRDQDVRAVLHRVADVADQTGCTVLLLRHLNKTAGGSAMYRGGGSIGIVGAARAGYVVAPDPDDPELRVLACVKSNLSAMPESLSYRLEAAPGSHVARVVWAGASVHGAGELLRPVEGDDERDERNEVVEWLKDLLAAGGGAAEAKDIYRQAGHAGYSRDQVKRAKKRLGATAQKPGMSEGWVWTHDPEGSAKGAKGAGFREPPPSLPSPLPSSGATDLSDRREATPQCTGCGQPLLLVRPGRTVCERCHIAHERSA